METNNPGSLRNKFDQFGASPTEGLWNAIEKNLDEKKSKRGFIFWWWFTGIAAGIVLLIGTYYLGYNNAKNDKQSSHSENTLNSNSNYLENQKAASVNLNSISENEIEKENLITSQTVNSAIDKKNESTQINQPEVKNTKTLQINSEIGKNNQEFNSLINSEIKIPKSSKIVDDLVSNYETKTPNALKQNNDAITFKPDYVLTELNFQKFIPEWELSISANHFFTSPIEQSYYLADITLGTADLSNNENLINNSGALVAGQSPETGNIMRPLGIQFQIGYRAKPRITYYAGLGLNYFKTQSYYNGTEAYQATTNYFSVTVPINVGYHFINRSHFQTSIDAGLMYEIPFHYSNKTTYTNSAFESFVKTKGFISGTMFSANTTLHLAYKFNNQMKLGAYGGVSHYLYQSANSNYPILERNTWGIAGIRFTMPL